MIKVTRETATLTPAIEVERGRGNRNGLIPVRDELTVRDLTVLRDQPVATYIDFDKKQQIEQIRRSIARKHATGLTVVRRREVAR